MQGTSYTERMTVRYPNIVQLYSVNTPNGIKVAACLEELVNLKGIDNFDYEPHTVDIRHAENRSEEFARFNPNQKIPVLIDPNGGGQGQAITVFESGAILLYLAERYDELLPKDFSQRVEVIKWLFWGSTGISSKMKLFGFYYKHCPHSLPYCVARYTKEVGRLFQVLERQLSHRKHWITGGMCCYATTTHLPSTMQSQSPCLDSSIHQTCTPSLTYPFGLGSISCTTATTTQPR